MDYGMKHDIIDNSTGNIVGCISFSDNDTAGMLADINLAHRLIDELQDRLHVLEQQFVEHLETHC
jgi:hypothetical protein